MRVTRAGFCRGAAASLVAAGLPRPLAWAAAVPSPLRLRVGVLSDIHVSTDEESTYFVKALREFDRARVDAVLVAGDLTTWGREDELAAVARAWFSVFPADRRSDGGRVERLFVTGNHDVDGCAYPGSGYKSPEEARKTGFYYNRDALWQRYFKEPYAPVTVKRVKGYAFVLRHWISILGRDAFEGKWPGFVDEVSPLPELLPAVDLPADKPFFYVQHDQMDDTTNATWLVDGKRWKNGQDRGEARAVLKAYPNCLALTGHCHNSLTDEMSIWQGEFTAVNCSCMAGWEFTPPGRENGFSIPDFGRRPPFEMPAIDFQSVRQGLVMDVYDDRIVLKRKDFLNDMVLGEDWVVPLFAGRTVPPDGEPAFGFAARARKARAPEFAEKDAVVVRQTADGRRRAADGVWPDKSAREQVWVEFPPVTRVRGAAARAFDYVVTCETRQKTLVSRRVFSPGFFLAETREPSMCRCAFARHEVPVGQDVRFLVRPCDCWGHVGRPLASPWMRL